VDEWALFRQGVSSVLRSLHIEVVGEAQGASDALMQLWSSRPSLLVAGSPAFTRLPALVIQARKTYPDLRILALLPASEVGAGRSVLSSGADAVLTRTASPDELEQALRKVLAGERVLAAAAVSFLVGGVLSCSGSSEHPLTIKELEVLGLLARGLRNKDIAAKLVVNISTVKTHLTNINRKLGVRDRQEALGRAIEMGLLA
jgi:DNA-binding NarL/FixJ family response regulator